MDVPDFSEHSRASFPTQKETRVEIVTAIMRFSSSWNSSPIRYNVDPGGSESEVSGR